VFKGVKRHYRVILLCSPADRGICACGAFTGVVLFLATSVLAQSTQPADLIERLGDRSPAARREAVQRLKAVGVPTLPLLRKALRDDDPHITAGAAMVMRELPRTRPGDLADIILAIS
jgi:hypothetical protein